MCDREPKEKNSINSLLTLFFQILNKTFIVFYEKKLNKLPITMSSKIL